MQQTNLLRVMAEYFQNDAIFHLEVHISYVYGTSLHSSISYGCTITRLHTVQVAIYTTNVNTVQVAIYPTNLNSIILL